MRDSIYKAVAGVLALVNAFVVLGMTGCTTANEDHINTGTAGTPESTEVPAASVEYLFRGADQEYFVPFQDPDHSFCTITEGWGTPVRQQGMGGCYCYAAVTCMQSGYMKEKGELIDINPVDIINRIYGVSDSDYPEEKYYIKSGLETDLGGDMFKVTGALCDVPLNGYLISETNIYGSYNTGFKDFDKVAEDDIKNAVRENGAVCISMNYSKDCKYINGYYTQNYQDNLKDQNHIAAIVGWDDDFPADCFATPASGNGAWLVQNSFGEFWGNCGYYWMSYDMPVPLLYDCRVTRDYPSAYAYGHYVMATVYSPGLIGRICNGEDISSFTLEDVLSADDVVTASVFEHKGSLGAVGFWTTFPGQPYTIEIRQGEFGKVLTTKSGTFKYTGYHTVEFEKPLSVKKFTVIVKTAGAQFFEGSSTDDYNAFTILQKLPCHYEAKCQPGRSFVQIEGEWVDVTDPDLLSRLGYNELPPELAEDAVAPGDPCITVLFR